VHRGLSSPSPRSPLRGEFIDVGGIRLYYYATGTRGAGEPVVLIHGFPTSGHLWADVASMLPYGHRIVVLDLLGYGRSDPPAARPLGVDAHADRVVALLDALSIREACIVGHGFGGGVAQSLAVRFPARASRLCLINSVAFDAWPSPTVRAWRRLHALIRLAPPSWIQSIIRTSLQRGYADTDRGLHSLEHYARAFGSPQGRQTLVQHLRAFENSETRAIGPRLGEISVPTAIVWGRLDPFLPVSLGERLQGAIPHATLDVVPSAGHFTPEDTPAVVRAAVAQLLAR
jgi:pimeloyl-ACP methyl ester carboxylesterase